MSSLSLQSVDQGNAFVIHFDRHYLGEVYKTSTGWNGIHSSGRIVGRNKKDPLQAAARLKSFYDKHIKASSLWSS
jgi:hypothetical protein